MRWLMIGLLVSLLALLVAAAGVARHIWVQHAKLRQKPPSGLGQNLDPDHSPDEVADVETEI